MAKRKAALPEGATNAAPLPAPPPGEPPRPSKEQKSLSWAHERFVEYFVRNGGNAAKAYRYAYPKSAPASWGPAGSRLLRNVSILSSIEVKRESDREAIAFSRQDALRILAGMATASLDDFTDIFSDPADKENYRGLGDKRFAIESAKRTITTIRGEEGGVLDKTELKIISPGERRNAINELWEKLGLGEGSSKGNWFDGLEQLAELVRGSKKGQQ